MARLPRVNLEGVLYYIVSYAMPGEELFKDKSDYEQYLKLLKENKPNFKLFSFLLLPDRISLLLELKLGSSISQIMHNLNNSYTKYFNGKYGNRPHLFKGRYESKIVEKTYLLKLVNYLNKKGMNCPYSSYSLYIKEKDFLPIKEEIEDVLMGINENYKDYIMKISEEEIKNIENLLEKKRIIGSKEFRDMVKEKIASTKNKNIIKSEANNFVSQIPIFPKKFAYLFLSLFFVLIGLLSYFIYKNQQTIKLVQLQMQLAQKKLEDAENEVKLAQSDNLKEAKKNPALAISKTSEVKSEAPSESIKKLVNYDEKPVGLKYLEGTVWEVEIKFSNKEIITDKLIFNNRKFSSQKFNEKGFLPTNYSVRYKENNVMVWESTQTNQKGETITWYGEYDGNVMKGILFEKNGEEEKSFSFISVKKAGIS